MSRSRQIASIRLIHGALVSLSLIAWPALVVSLSKGRTTLTTLSFSWLLTALAILGALSIWAMFFALVLSRTSRPTRLSLSARVALSTAPLLLSIPCLVAIYGSDAQFHFFMANQVSYSLAVWSPFAGMLAAQQSVLAWSARLPETVQAWLRRERSLPILVFAAFFVLFVFSSGGHLYSPDEIEMYQITESIADLAVPLVYYDDLAPTDGARRYYSKYGLVTSILGVPPYLVSRAFGLEPDPPSAAFPIPNGSYPLVDLLVNPLVAAATCGFLYALARRMAFGKLTALAVTLVYGMGTSSWVYSKTYFSQPSAALFLLGATFFCLRGSKSLTRDSALAGAMLGLAAGSRIETLIIGLPLLIVLWRRVREDREEGLAAATAFAAAFGLCAGITAGWYNYVKTGSVLSSGYGQQGTLAGFSTKPYLGLFGSLFSAGFGLVTYNPVVALGAVAFPILSAKRSFEARVFGSMIAIAVILYGSFGDWFGGFTWANRYLVVILPFAVLPVGVLLERPWRSSLGILFLAAATALGFAINLLAVLFDFNNGWLDLWDHRASLLQIQWDAHFSPIGAHVRLLGNFLATGAKLDLYLLYKLGLPALVVFGLVLSFLVTMMFRSAAAEPSGEMDFPGKRA